MNTNITAPAKKPYVSMQVSQLGKLADLTQAMFFGKYGDGGTSGVKTSGVVVKK